jgi:exopolysaccharide biosynthesis operon protein EpsL
MKYKVVVMLVALLSAAGQAYCGEAEPEETLGLDLTLGAREMYDDNLYRRPESASSQSGNEDYIRRISAGLDGRWQWSRQKVLVDLLAMNNAYQRNDQLDNTSGRARAEWKWRAGSAWSGALGGDFSRMLASFSATQFRGKDLLDVTGTFASLAFRPGPRWTLKAAGRSATTEHGAEERRYDNFRTDSLTTGLYFKTASETEIGVSARRTAGRFERAVEVGGQLFDRNYDDEITSLELNQTFSPRTHLELSVGYLRRRYEDAALADVNRSSVDGTIGELLLGWQAANKIELTLNGWRRLRAYLDAESEYFISKGFSIGPSWKPTEKISVALELAYERQAYLGTSVSPQYGAREDRVHSGRLEIGYSPTRKLRFDLTGNLEERVSNRSVLAYDSQVASVGVRWTY